MQLFIIPRESLFSRFHFICNLLLLSPCIYWVACSMHDHLYLDTCTHNKWPIFCSNKSLMGFVFDLYNSKNQFFTAIIRGLGPLDLLGTAVSRLRNKSPNLTPDIWKQSTWHYRDARLPSAVADDSLAIWREFPPNSSRFDLIYQVDIRREQLTPDVWGEYWGQGRGGDDLNWISYIWSRRAPDDLYMSGGLGKRHDSFKNISRFCGLIFVSFVFFLRLRASLIISKPFISSASPSHGAANYRESAPRVQLGLWHFRLARSLRPIKLTRKTIVMAGRVIDDAGLWRWTRGAGPPIPFVGLYSCNWREIEKKKWPPCLKEQNCRYLHGTRYKRQDCHDAESALGRSPQNTSYSYDLNHIFRQSYTYSWDWWLRLKLKTYAVSRRLSQDSHKILYVSFK